MGQTCADLLAKADAYAVVSSDLASRGLMTPAIQTAIDSARSDLDDRVASAVQADTQPGSPLPEAITYGGHVFSFDNASGKPHLDEVTVRDAATVPVPDDTPAPPAPPDQASPQGPGGG